MPSSYPGALDNFAEASPSFMSDPDATGRVHSRRHDDVESALEAVQGFLGARREAGAGFPQWKRDDTVGRRLFAWDVLNNRWQMIYADTGWRNVGAQWLINGWTGTVVARRFGYAIDIQILGDLSGGSSSQFLSLPVGWRNTWSCNVGMVRTNSDSTWRGIWYAGGVLDIAGFPPGSGLTLPAISLNTVEAWPSVLPGTAEGAVPSADVDQIIPTGLAE